MASESMVPGILRLRLGECLTAETRRMIRDLHEVGLALRNGRNRMARTWQRWREDNPDWKPGQRRDSKGKPKETKEGKPVMESGAFPQSAQWQGETCHFQTFLKKSAKSVCFRVSDTLADKAAKQVLQHLEAKMPYNHDGKAKFLWEAILSGEANLQSFKGLNVPFPNNSCIVGYQGHCNNGSTVKSLRSVVEEHAQSSAVIGFPLFSTSAGRKQTFHVCRVEVEKLTEGLRAILLHLAKGEWKISDSRFVYKTARHNSRRRRKKGEEGTWYLHLFYRAPVDSPLLNAQRAAALTLCAPTAFDPFQVSIGDHGWEVGRGQLFRRIFTRLNMRRKEMRQAYKVCGHGRKGHGQQRNQRDTRHLSRRILNLCNDILNKTVCDIIRFCTQHNCGKLRWSEPALSVRAQTWFARNGVQWDWTLFGARLRQACTRARITLVDPRKTRERIS